MKFAGVIPREAAGDEESDRAKTGAIRSLGKLGMTKCNKTEIYRN